MEDHEKELLASLSSKVDGLVRKAAASEDLEKLEKSHKALEETCRQQVELQDQKDTAQDELLAMQFDSLKRDLSTAIKGQDLEDQKTFLLAKVNNFDLEMKESLRTLSNALREEISKDSRRLQEQLEKVSGAVVQQIKMVDQRLKENAEADSLFEELVRTRLARVEGVLGLGDDGEAGTQELPAAATAAIDAKFDEMTACFAKLQQMVQDQQKSLEEIRENPGGSGGNPGKTKQTLEDRVGTLEDKVEDVIEKEAETGRQVQELKDVVERGPNPLDWLEERVGQLAKRQAGNEKVEMAKRLEQVCERVEALEKWRTEEPPKEPAFVTAIEEEEGDKEEGEEGEGEDEISESSSRRLGTASSRRGRGGGVNIEGAELRYVDLFEDMERLRCIIEAMEDSMPLEVRKRIQFFKGGRKGGAEEQKSSRSKGTSSRGRYQSQGAIDKHRFPGGMELDAEVFDLRNESEEQAQRVQRMEELLARENASLHKAVRGIEQSQDQMKLKVDDLWHKLPQLSAVLDPLQLTIVPPGNDGADVQIQAETTIEALRPLTGLVETSIQKSISLLREDLVSTLIEVKGGLDTKASVDDFSLLRDRVERWARSPTSPSKPTLASYKGKADMDSTNPWLSPTRSKGPGTSVHEKCKVTSCHHSASTGRLPSLHATR